MHAFSICIALQLIAAVVVLFSLWRVNAASTIKDIVKTSGGIVTINRFVRIMAMYFFEKCEHIRGDAGRQWFT